MKISEIFYSVQGEGALVGVPSIFIRTSGCNLRCTWCDTPYTSWTPEGTAQSVEEILSEIAKYPARHVVLTGGEPMIAAETPALTKALRTAGYHITIETAGTVDLPVECDLMSISPKLAHSTPVEREGGRWAAQHERLRIQPEVLQKLCRTFDYQMKFVVQAVENIPEMESVIQAAGASAERVILMPEGVDPEILRTRSLWLVEICKARGFRFSPRLHVDLWGPRRGV